MTVNHTILSGFRLSLAHCAAELQATESSVGTVRACRVDAGYHGRGASIVIIAPHCCQI